MIGACSKSECSCCLNGELHLSVLLAKQATRCGFCCSFSLQELSRSRMQAHLELLCLETVLGRVGH